ncbi:MAG: chromatin modification- protein VID21 [Pleopsidium flavum]|nr:MAG: chromatin modification- protein VID21 [Pleopsidium flavum]
MFRDAILRTKRDELGTCVASRKRKLSELYFATVSIPGTEPLPQQLSYRTAKTYNNDEFAFLQANDIAKQSPTLEESDDRKRLGAPIKSFTETIALEGDLSIEDNGTTSNNGRSLRGTSANAATSAPSPQASKASQTEPQDTVESSLDAIIDATIDQVEIGPTTIDNQPQTQSEVRGNTVNNTLGSARGSPGVNPNRAIPLLSEDTAFLPEPSAKLSEAELGSDRACTVHLPPKEVQERHLREVDQSQENVMRRDRREDEKHPPSGGPPVMTDLASSPSSTVGPYSAATPGHNALSPDTSPGDEILSDVKTGLGDRMESTDVAENSERAAENEHNSLLKSQMEIARLDALGTDPSTPDAQLRFEEAQSMHAPDAVSDDRTRPVVSSNVTSTFGLQDSAELTRDAQEMVENTMDDEDDEVVGVPTPEDEEGVKQSIKGHSLTFGKVSVPKGADWNIQEAGCEGITDADQDPLDKLQSSRKPNMHIDTRSISTGGELSDREFSKLTTSPEQMLTSLARPDGGSVIQTTASPNDLLATTTQKRPRLTTPVVHGPPERMTTRVSSGAIRHKSVSEILGETPRPSALPVERPLPDNEGSADSTSDNPAIEILNSALGVHTPHSSTSRLRLGERREKEKERSKLSTVIFAKPQSLAKVETSDLARPIDHDLEESSQVDKDYLYTLFVAQASSQPPTQPLNTLLASAHKTLTTSNHYIDFHEQQDCRMLKRIYQLQYTNRWSLRQIERSIEPVRPTTHWDVLLGQMKWMRTDFREERKWKMAAAKNVADWCAEWIASNAEDRGILQVRRRPVTDPDQADVVREHAEIVAKVTPLVDKSGMQDLQPMPDLVPSADDDSVCEGMEEDERHHQYLSCAPPSAIFALAPEDVIFDLRSTPASEKILSELPLYEPIRDAPYSELPTSVISPDADWRIPCLPISKFTIGKMVSKQQEPPQKRSRYEYEAEDQGANTDVKESPNDSATGPCAGPMSNSYRLASEQNDVALFNPENKHIRDRIHAGHAFRPPSEYNMPSQSFFECRQSSQWTWTEDDELRRLVKEYSYNWSLISSCLSTPSLFSSGAERRTPWECFERWVGLEGLPADMSKTQYFRAYHARLEAAQRTLVTQQQVAQQQQGNNPAQPPVRRRTAQPVRVERRKNNKHLALMDAMRKLAKKRETSIQKQQHAAGLAALRKANEATQPRAPVHTPQDFSRLKYDRECKMQERADAYRQQVLAQQRAALAQRAAQQSNQQHALPNGAILSGRNGTPGTANAASPRIGSALPNGTFQAGMPSQARQHPTLQAMPNSAQQNGSLPGAAQMGIKGMPQAQMQPNASGQQRLPTPQLGPENMRVFLEANRLQHEQQRFLQQRQQQQHQPGQSGPSSSPTMGSLNGVPPSNPAMLAALQAANGVASPSTNGMPSSTSGPSASPRLAQATQPQSLSSGVVPAINTISNQIKARHPQLSSEQINKMTTDSLKQYQMSQAAMSAAAGGAANTNGSLQPSMQQQAMMNGVGGSVQNAQAYAQYMRQQQANQQSRGGGPGVNGVRPPSRSTTPQRSGSVQAGQVQSPRAPQAQMAGGV